jgi:hypothetical protein
MNKPWRNETSLSRTRTMVLYEIEIGLVMDFDLRWRKMGLKLKEWKIDLICYVFGTKELAIRWEVSSVCSGRARTWVRGCKLFNYFSVIFSKQNHGTTFTKLWKNIHHSNYTNSSTSHYLTPQHRPSKHQSLTIHNQHLNIGKIKHDSCHVSMASVTYLHLLHPIQLFHIVTNLLKGKTLEWQLFKITN